MENSQKVRHIPIFVEGRDQPIINKDHNGSQSSANASSQNSSNSTSASATAESSTGQFQPQQQQHFQHQNFPRPPMNFDDIDGMGFGDIPHGSIFERAKDFPVRSEFPDFFNMRSASPRRSESPSQGHHPHHTVPPQHHQQQPQYQQQQQQQQQQQPRKSPSTGGGGGGVRQSNSGERQVPVQHDVKRSSTPQRQPTPPKQPQQQQQNPQKEESAPAAPPQPQLSPEERAAAAKKKAIEDSIMKIQKIQQSVIDLMTRVERYDGIDKKEYMYLDEMLTQDLLKLDNIDAEGNDIIKNARREAIKCINSLISLLEAKNDEVSNNGVAKSESNEKSNSQEANQNIEQTPMQNNKNCASRNSSYDNVNEVQQTGSSNSVHMKDVPAEKTVEANLEEKIANAISKRDEQEVQQKQT